MKPSTKLVIATLASAAGCSPAVPGAPHAALETLGTTTRPGEGELLRVGFDDDPIGPYPQERLSADFKALRGRGEGLDEGRVSIVATERGRALRVAYPRGSVGPSQGGAQFFVDLPGGHDELYCSYRVRFAEGFDFVRGGKLPGLVGGSHPTGGKPADDGFSARLMWRRGGAVVQYVYYPHQTTEYGVDLAYLLSGDAPARFQPGVWHRVEHRIVMNTPGNANGILQGWMDGHLALDQHDRLWRLTSDIHIDALYFSTFFGGNDPSWGATRDESVDFDDFVVSQHPIGG